MIWNKWPVFGRLSYQSTLAQARVAMRREDWCEAEALLMSAGSIAGDDPAFFNLVGVLWEVRGNRRAAKRFYGRAIHADSRYAPAQQNMRRLYELDTFGRTRQCVALGDERRENGAARAFTFPIPPKRAPAAPPGAGRV